MSCLFPFPLSPPHIITKLDLHFLILFYRSSCCSHAWRRFVAWNPAFPLVWLFHRTCLFCIRCCFVYLLVTCPVQRLLLFHLLLPSFLSFTLRHMRGFPTYKMNVALFFSSRTVCGGAVGSTVATCFLKVLSHPCNWCSPLPRLRVPHCWFWDLAGASPVQREVGATDHSHKHRTVTGRSYQGLFHPFLLFSKLLGKTGMK